MPIHPIPFNFEEASKKWFRDKSQEFLRIEGALSYYLKQPPLWANLKMLLRMITKWKANKAGPTIRDTSMQRLDQWLQDEIAALKPWPNPELNWNANHNCYAYAMKCKQDGRNNARPGKFAGVPRATQDQDFAQGVVDDAHHQHKNAWVLQKGGVASPVPGLTHGGYLVVMISIPMGYHFMRRDNHTGLWTHKNGPIREVETSFEDPDDFYLEAEIDNAAMIKVITDARIRGPWVFDAYLEIQGSGIIVEG